MSALKDDYGFMTDWGFEALSTVEMTAREPESWLKKNLYLGCHLVLKQGQ